MDNAAGWMITGNHIYGVDGDDALYANRLYGILDQRQLHRGLRHHRGPRPGPGRRRQHDHQQPDLPVNAGRGGTFLQVIGNYGNAKAAVDRQHHPRQGLGIGLDYQRGTAESLEVISTGNLVSEVEVDRQVGEGVTVNPGLLVDDGTL